MAKSTYVLPRSLLRAFIQYLQEHRYEVDESVIGWRILMYRKHKLPWTQGYYGKTRSGIGYRSFLRFAGPEEKVVQLFLENYDGTLA